MEPLKYIKELNSIKPITAGTLGLFSLVTLLEIDTYLDALDLSLMRNYGKTYISIITVLAFSYLPILAIPSIRKAVINFQIHRRIKRKIISKLKELSTEETQILCLYWYGGRKTLSLNPNLASVRSLLNAKVIILM